MRILSVVLLVVVLLACFMVIKNNRIPSGLGVTKGQFKALNNKPNGVSSQAEDASKFVQAIPFLGSLESTKLQLKAACETFGECEIITETADYLHVVFETGTMKYHDDVEFYFDTDKKMVHYRSESRIGYSDMGLNKERYDAIVQSYNSLKEAN